MKRVIAYPVGGIGNQLFIYAAAWAFAQRERLELVLDPSNFSRDTFYRRTYALQHFNTGDVRLIDNGNTFDFVYRLYRSYRQMFPTMPPRLGPILGEADYLQFEPLTVGGAIRLFPTIYLLGYRQNEQYFADQAAGLRRKLEFVFAPSVEARRRAGEIRACNAVGVHFRQLHQVPSGETRPNLEIPQLAGTYYAQAVARMRQQVPDARFFCFGDSLANLERLIDPEPNVVALPPVSDGPTDISDLWLMKQCRHFILSNSTFGWWAAWLGAQGDSHVFCPDTRGFANGIAPARGWEVI
jgi:Glycosyl transferase family 11